DFSSEGNDPVAGAAGDFNGDGNQDLLVANNSGAIALLLGGAQGLEFAQSFSDAELRRPSDLALSAVDNRSFYVTYEGAEAVVRFSFDFKRQQGDNSPTLTGTGSDANQTLVIQVASTGAGGLTGDEFAALGGEGAGRFTVQGNFLLTLTTTLVVGGAGQDG